MNKINYNKNLNDSHLYNRSKSLFIIHIILLRAPLATNRALYYSIESLDLVVL